MDTVQRTELLKMDSLGAVYSLIDWPFHNILVQVIVYIESFLHEKYQELLPEVYYTFLQYIACRSSEYQNCVFKALFENIWKKTSIQLKEILMTDFPLLCDLFWKKRH